MQEELTTEDVEDYIHASDGRIFVRIPVMGGNDVAVDRAVGLIRSIESEVGQDDIDIIIFSNNSVVHSRVAKNEKDAKSKICEKLVYRLHLDYLPYTELIVSVPKNEKNAELIRQLCLRYGINFDRPVP